MRGASNCDMGTVLRFLLATLVVGEPLSHAAHHKTPSTPQKNLCKALGGECLKHRQSCEDQTLPSRLCGPQGGTCCTSAIESLIEVFQRRVKRLPVREVCHKTSKKCRKRGGSCVSLSSPCNTYAAKKFCGSDCTCCVGDHTSCTAEPACKRGFCFKGSGKRMCRGGKIIPSGCKGRRCSCCIPKESQSVTGSNADQCSCGQSNGKRIVGGKEVTPHKYPWLVGLLVPPYEEHFCGGTIISPEFVLTAAHCLFDHSTKKVYSPRKLKVRVGDHNQFSHLDDVEGVTRLVDVMEIIPHDTFLIFRPYHDIGLLRLATKLDLTTHMQVRAVCLPRNSFFTYEGAVAVASGWGVKAEDNNLLSDVVREVRVPILGPTCKNTQYGDVTLTSNMLCAGLHNEGKDTCLGDSGGPLTVEVYNRHDIIGITSFGIGCGRYPGVYTRITAYLSWIRSMVQDTCTNT